MAVLVTDQTCVHMQFVLQDQDSVPPVVGRVSVGISMQPIPGSIPHANRTGQYLRQSCFHLESVTQSV